MWTNLGEDITEEFSRLSDCVDVGVDVIGLRRHDYLTTTRATTDGSRPGQTDAQRAEKRKALEASRREYKARKAREYYAQKRAA
jgi:hypothetical protein